MASILIVDDSIVMRKNLKTILRQAGHFIAGEANNGRQAVSQYIDLNPDIVTMDISMPIMSGVEAVTKIMEIDPKAKIIMVSAVNQKKMVFNAINQGAKHYIVKPIDSKKIVSIIEEVLENNDEQHQESNEETLKQTVQGFQIDNVEGTFIIRFNNCLSIKDHNALGMAIRGIIFIKPLKVTFNFEEVLDISDEVLEPIMRLSQEVVSADGVVSFSARPNIMDKIEK